MCESLCQTVYAQICLQCVPDVAIVTLCVCLCYHARGASELEQLWHFDRKMDNLGMAIPWLDHSTHTETHSPQICVCCWPVYGVQEGNLTIWVRSRRVWTDKVYPVRSTVYEVKENTNMWVGHVLQANGVWDTSLCVWIGETVIADAPWSSGHALVLLPSGWLSRAEGGMVVTLKSLGRLKA